jgi:hypothetical protein
LKVLNAAFPKLLSIVLNFDKTLIRLTSFLGLPRSKVVDALAQSANAPVQDSNAKVQQQKSVIDAAS